MIAHKKTRSSRRHRRRYRIALTATGAAAAAAFTVDVSAGGFCAELMRVPAPGTEVTGAIMVDGREYPFRGAVAWARGSEPRMNVRGRIGVVFREVAGEYAKTLLGAPQGKVG
jgi:hypothetical protein